MSMEVRNKRLKKELEMFSSSPPSGLSFYPVGESLTDFEAQIVPEKDSIYSGVTFKLQVTIPDNFPFYAPVITFVTPIFHPNIDSSGRICLDILKDKYVPCLTISDLLLAIRNLMDCPNVDDPLRPEAAHILKTDQSLYLKMARRRTWELPYEELSDQDLYS